MNEDKYAIKTDDLLLRLLNDYHSIDASEAVAFFGERAKEMLECEPNITERSRSPITHYLESGINRTITFTHKDSRNSSKFKMKLQKMNIGNNKVYVLRGFYPNTHLPFKMTLFQLDGKGTARCRVRIGLKEHHTKISEKQITDYNNAASEAILLSAKVREENKIEYTYRKFKCMRPKGMKLYHEKNYADIRK